MTSASETPNQPSSTLARLALGIPLLPSIPEFPSLTSLSEFLLTHPLTDPITSTPSYALTIILLTLLVRTSTTLPTTLWSRARARRMREIVKPKMQAINKKLAVDVMKECRRAGLGYDAYKVELKKRLAEQQAILVKEHRCHPVATVLYPPLVHIPIFLVLSLTIRQAVNTPLPVTDPASSISTTILPFAQESFAWLPNLYDTDPYLALPFAIGLMAFSNVEVMQRWRSDLRMEPAVEEAAVSSAVSSASARRPTPSLPPHRRFSTSSPSLAVKGGVRIPGRASKSINRDVILQSESEAGNMTPEEREKRRLAKQQGGMRERIIGNILRLVAVASVGIAAEVPAAVALYWATSTTFTLVQNVILGWLDRRRSAAKAVSA